MIFTRHIFFPITLPRTSRVLDKFTSKPSNMRIAASNKSSNVPDLIRSV